MLPMCGTCRRSILQALIDIPIQRDANAAARRRFSKTSSASPVASRANVRIQGSLHERPEAFDTRSHTPRRAIYSQNWKKDQSSDSHGAAEESGKHGAKTVPNWVVQKQLQYLKDPVKLAEYVVQRCRNGGFEEAQEVVRMASKSLSCTVSWNHLIDFQMSQGKMNSAFKTYNEMKKRRQMPDARTYTIIITGCTHHPEPRHALEKGLALYRSMRMDNSAVKPNQIHVNAVLKLCAQARDIPSMFEIAANLPSQGPGSLDNVAFTTLLNTIQRDADLDTRLKLTNEQQRNYVQKRLVNARKIWGEITRRWRKGDLWIDEELVCAMGRILLLGDERDRDDILTMIEHAMGIPRQLPRLGTGERSQIEPSHQKHDGQTEPSLVIDKQDIDGNLPNDTHVAQSNTSLKPKHHSLGSFARPSQPTLALIMDSLLSARLKATALKYWHHFTHYLGIIPDGPNYHSLLRILREARASGEALDLLQSMPAQLLAQKTFRIALSTCRRDANNPNAFVNAGKILDIMSRTIRSPDVKTLDDYLNISTSLPRRIEARSTTDEPGPTKYSQGRQILRALQRVHPFWLNLATSLKYDSHPSQHNLRQQADDLLLISGAMVRGYDVLIDKALVPRDDFSLLVEKKKKMHAAIARVKRSRAYQPLPAPRAPRHALEATRDLGTEQDTSQERQKIRLPDVGEAVEVEGDFDIESLSLDHPSVSDPVQHEKPHPRPTSVATKSHHHLSRPYESKSETAARQTIARKYRGDGIENEEATKSPEKVAR